MVEMAEQAVEDFTLLVQKQVLQRRLLLLVEQLLHHLEEVAGEDGQRVVIFVEELAQGVHQGVVLLRHVLLLFSRLGELGPGKLGLAGVVGLVRLLLLVIFHVL